MAHKIVIDDLVRDATPTEAAAINAYHAEVISQTEAKEQDDTARAAARQTVLDKLGLTADEAAALFG